VWGRSGDMVKEEYIRMSLETNPSFVLFYAVTSVNLLCLVEVGLHYSLGPFLQNSGCALHWLSCKRESDSCVWTLILSFLAPVSCGEALVS